MVFLPWKIPKFSGKNSFPAIFLFISPSNKLLVPALASLPIFGIEGRTLPWWWKKHWCEGPRLNTSPASDAPCTRTNQNPKTWLGSMWGRGKPCTRGFSLEAPLVNHRRKIKSDLGTLSPRRKSLSSNANKYSPMSVSCQLNSRRKTMTDVGCRWIWAPSVQIPSRGSLHCTEEGSSDEIFTYL